MVRVHFEESLDHDQGDDGEGEKHLENAAASGGVHRLRRLKVSQTRANWRAWPGCGWTAQIEEGVARTNREGFSWPQRTHWPRWSCSAPE